MDTQRFEHKFDRILWQFADRFFLIPLSHSEWGVALLRTFLTCIYTFKPFAFRERSEAFGALNQLQPG